MKLENTCKSIILIQFIQGYLNSITTSSPQPPAGTPRLPRLGQNRARAGPRGSRARLVRAARSPKHRPSPEQRPGVHHAGQKLGCGQQVPPPAKLRPQPREEVVQMRDQEAADLQRDAHDGATGEQREEDHAVGDQLRGDSEEPDGGLHAALVLVGRVAEGYEEGREEDVVGSLEEGSVSPGDFVQSLSRLASFLLKAAEAKERKRVKRCRVLKTTRQSMGKPAESSI